MLLELLHLFNDWLTSAEQGTSFPVPPHFQENHKKKSVAKPMCV